MNRENLRKVKWNVGTEYHYGDKKLTNEQAHKYTNWQNDKELGIGTVTSYTELIEELGEDNFNNIEPVAIYKYGYFHQWVVENCGDSYSGYETYVYALVEIEEGRVRKFNYDEIIFIDKFDYEKLDYEKFIDV